MSRIILTLPSVPPSVNAMYGTASNRRRYLTPKAKAWKARAAWAVKAQIAGMPVIPVTTKINVRITLPVGTRGDVDNRCKPTLDMLQEAGVIEDDKQCERVTIERSHVSETVIEIDPAETWKSLAEAASPVFDTLGIKP